MLGAALPRHARRSCLPPRRHGRAPCSSALQARLPPAGWRDRRHHTAGRHGRRHSAPLRDRGRGPRAPDPAVRPASLAAAVAAAMAPGPTTPRSASSMASSTRNPPKAMQCGPPLSIQAAAAAVARDVMLRARVAERQLASAAAAADQAGQQRIAVLGRAMMPAGGNVAADHRADRLGPLPAHIALHGRSASAPANRCRALRRIFTLDAVGVISRRDGRLTIGIGAAVDRVLDHPVDGGVVWAPPSRVAVVLLHRQIEIMLVEPAAAPAVRCPAPRPCRRPA